METKPLPMLGTSKTRQVSVLIIMKNKKTHVVPQQMKTKIQTMTMKRVAKHESSKSANNKLQQA